MRALAVALFGAAVCLVNAQQNKEEKEFKCPVEQGNGNFADPVTCRRFYQCVDGFPYLNRCPSGLYFDDIQKYCTFKAEAKCGPLAATPAATTESPIDLAKKCNPAECELPPKPVYEQALGVTLAVTLVLAAVLALNARRWILPECSPAKSTQPIKQIVLFDLYKCFGAVGVVLAHCCLFGSFLMPMKNIDLLEEVIAHPYAKFWRLFCPFLMLAFFVMSSMLLTVKLMHGDPSKRPTLGAIISHRLIRLMPVNLLMVAFGALVYDRFAGGGPLLSRQLIVEQGFCRSYWWMNVLFISNFNMQRPCLPDSWYVSADMQLYVVIALALQMMFR